MIQGYLLDTNIFGYLLNTSCPEHTIVHKKYQQLPSDTPLRTSLVVLGEVTYGFHVAPHKNKTYPKAVLDFIRNEFPSPLSIRPSTTQIYGQLRAALFEKYAPKKRQKGLRPEQLIDPVTAESLGIQENDLWIVSQALERNLVLVTNDKMNHLCSIASDLKVENWTMP